ncbi:MAG TPA: AtpZ/AtpI family protein [Beijerinckiaceae bacterium]|nr:AtpZ/AtpI family protein [Beijerinckiaceae bacterium]
MADKITAGEDEALKRRLDQLGKVLDGKRQDAEETARQARKGPDGGLGKAMGTGFRVASELAAAILVGGLIGWQVDAWAGSGPWGLLGFLMLGVLAGFWSVYKLAARPTGGEQPPHNG